MSMDLLSTMGWSRKVISSLIDGTEAKYPSLKQDNERIRALMGRPDVVQAIAASGIDVDAAMISSCRSDVLCCGRCAFWAALRKSGI